MKLITGLAIPLAFAAGMAHAQGTQPITKAKAYGESVEITAERVAKCQRNLKKAGPEMREAEVRDKQTILPVTIKFIALDFPQKETLAFCASLRAGKWKEFVPLNLVYVTNYKPYGSYNPSTGLQVNF